MSSIVKCLLLGLALLAAKPALPAEESDPPGRVGRVSLATENTRLRIGDHVAQGGTALNWPLTTGAILQTGSGARSEARIGSTILRIDGNSEIEFVEVSDGRIWLRLHGGSLLMTLNHAEQAAETTLDTPDGRLRFEAPGIYRADVAGGTTAFSAYAGAAVVADLGLPLHRGERVLLLGGANRNYLLGAAAQDAFRQWALDQDQVHAAPPNRYVSPEMTGQEALDRNGTWHETGEYGAAWFPHAVPAGWAPYRMGRWAWIPPWGWTWIDQAPWGFAPFHYGRWVRMGGRWAWLPGAYVARPIYAPALVAWLGQPGWNVSLSLGSAPAVGWYPLGPHEIYYPHYRSSVRHLRHLNRSHNPHAERIVSTSPPHAEQGRTHAHRHRHEAVTVAPKQAVRSATPETPAFRSPSPSAPPSVPRAQGDGAKPAALPAVTITAPATPPTRPSERERTVPERSVAVVAPGGKPHHPSGEMHRHAAEPRPTPLPRPVTAVPAQAQPATLIGAGREAVSHNGRNAMPAKPREEPRERARHKPSPAER